MASELRSKKIVSLKALSERDKDKRSKEETQKRKLKDRYKFMIGEMMINHFTQILELETKHSEQELDDMLQKFEKIIIASNINELFEYMD